MKSADTHNLLGVSAIWHEDLLFDEATDLSVKIHVNTHTHTQMSKMHFAKLDKQLSYMQIVGFYYNFGSIMCKLYAHGIIMWHSQVLPQGVSAHQLGAAGNKNRQNYNHF